MHTVLRLLRGNPHVFSGTTVSESDHRMGRPPRPSFRAEALVASEAEGSAPVKRCEVCMERPQRDVSLVWAEICGPCYERYHARTGRTVSMAIWTAREARRFERARQKGK